MGDHTRNFGVVDSSFCFFLLPFYYLHSLLFPILFFFLLFLFLFLSPTYSSPLRANLSPFLLSSLFLLSTLLPSNLLFLPLYSYLTSLYPLVPSCSLYPLLYINEASTVYLSICLSVYPPYPPYPTSYYPPCLISACSLLSPTLHTFLHNSSFSAPFLLYLFA